MALRFELSEGTRLPSDERSLVRLPAMRAPQTLEYRSPEDQVGLRAILNSVHCKIVGRTSVGKSSVLPKLIRLHGGSTVIIVTAHPLLAAASYDFFCENPRHGVDGSSLSATFLRDQETDISLYDLVWTSASQLCAWLMAKSERTDGAKPLTGMRVFLDEAHECDAYTHVVRTTSLQLGAKALLLVSATFEPSGHRVNPDNVDVRTYDQAEVVGTWDILERGKPWHYANIRDTAIIFVDSASAAVRLEKAFRDIAYGVHRLTARSTYKEYRAAVAALAAVGEPPVVLLLDRSYRSGFNFDVSVIIDTGILYYVDGEIGRIAYQPRGIFNVEMVQTAGRGGRFGRRTVYYAPTINCPTKICDLEPVEMEGAALVTRLLGFLPVRETADTVMTYDNLPADQPLLSSMNGGYPLSYYCRNKFGARKPGVRPVVIPPIVVVPVSRGAKTEVSAAVGASRRASVETVVSTSDASSCTAMLKAPSKASTVAVKGGPGSVVSKATTSRLSHAVVAGALIEAGKGSVVDSLVRSETTIGGREKYCPPSIVSSVNGEHLSPNDSVSVLGRSVRALDLTRANNASSSTVELGRGKPWCEENGAASCVCSTLSSVVTSATEGNWLGVFAGQHDGGATVTLEKNKYLCVHGIRVQDLIKTSRYFPLGVESITAAASGEKTTQLFGALRTKHREYAIHEAVQRYNVLTLELRSLKEAVRVVFGHCPQVLASGDIRRRVSRLVSKVTDWELERGALTTAIEALIKGRYDVAELVEATPSEYARALFYEKKLRSIRDKNTEVSASMLEDWMGSAAAFRVLEPAASRASETGRRSRGRSRTGESKSGRTVVYVKPCLGVSSITEQPDGQVDVRPSRIMRRLSGVDNVTMSAIQARDGSFISHRK